MIMETKQDGLNKDHLKFAGRNTRMEAIFLSGFSKIKYMNPAVMAELRLHRIYTLDALVNGYMLPLGDTQWMVAPSPAMPRTAPAYARHIEEYVKFSSGGCGVFKGAFTPVWDDHQITIKYWDECTGALTPALRGGVIATIYDPYNKLMEPDSLPDLQQSIANYRGYLEEWGDRLVDGQMIAIAGLSDRPVAMIEGILFHLAMHYPRLRWHGVGLKASAFKRGVIVDILTTADIAIPPTKFRNITAKGIENYATTIGVNIPPQISIFHPLQKSLI